MPAIASKAVSRAEACLAVDVGGTKVAAGLVGPDGSLSRVHMAPNPQGSDPESIFSALALVVDGVIRTAGRAAVVCGVGCGGPMTRGGDLVSPLNIPAWSRFPLRDRLSELTGLPTHVDNDAKALARGEGWVGAAAGCDNYMAMVVSTGVGGGIVLGGHLLDGEQGNAGHIGHVVVEPEGRACTCGGRGCLEAEASGLAIAAMTGRPASDASPGTIARVGTLVGRAVASVVNLLDLELVVVGGSVALGFGAPFFEAAQAEMSSRARLDYARRVRILAAGLGSDGPLVGAGAVGWRGLRRERARLP